MICGVFYSRRMSEGFVPTLNLFNVCFSRIILDCAVIEKGSIPLLNLIINELYLLDLNETCGRSPRSAFGDEIRA